MAVRLALALSLGLVPQAAPAPSFDNLSRRADAARVAGRLREAASLYRRALALRPRWGDGLWALGTIAYDEDRFGECRDVFARLSAVQPKLASAWALRGLCEFRLGSAEGARTHLARAVALGLPAREELGRVTRYHLALLLTAKGAFDLAIAPLAEILSFQPPTPELEAACGLVLLRRPILPTAVPEEDVDFVRQAGEAYCAHLGRHAELALPRYEALIREHPRQRYLHYGRGLALAQQGAAEAATEFMKEIELFPDDVLARIELGFGLLTRGREAEAVLVAEEAARLAPGLFVTHLLLGRALVATGQMERGIRELEAAAAMEPQIPEIQLALARAYARAGRKQEAARANTAFQSLEAVRRGASRPSPEAP